MPVVIPPSNNPSASSLPAAGLFVVFAPILLLVGVTAALAGVAWWIGWYRAEMVIAAEVTGLVAGILAMVLLYRQIRQREAATRALQSIRARASDVVESAMDAIVTVDDDQRVVLFNAAAEKVFGWPRDEVVGGPLDRLLPERFRDVHRRHVAHFGATGTTARRMGGKNVLTGLRADGREFPIEASISQHREEGRQLFTVILRDVSERVAAESRLAQSEGRLSGVLESAMDAIVIVDESQHVVLFNEAAEAMFGCPRGEAIGTPLASFIPERFRGAHTEHVRAFGAAGTAPRRMGGQRVVMGLRRDGAEFPIDASISQLDGPQGRFYTVILRDVTERVRADEALRHSKDELRELGAAAHAAREQEKTRIARELHDELAQSLAALQMDVAWCKRKVAENPPATAAKLAQMAGLLDDTVAATRRIAADLRPLMLDDLGLVPAVEWLAETFTQRSGIPCDLAVEGGEIDLPHAQATAVFRIVQESLANAAKHAKPERVQVAIGRRGTDLTLSIRDDGIGFSPEDPRKPESYGLLGLRERASLLGGTASITSAPGEGTRIDVRLPLSQEAPAS